MTEEKQNKEIIDNDEEDEYTEDKPKKVSGYKGCSLHEVDFD